MAAGAGVQAYGAYQQSKSAEALYEYNAAVKEREASQIRRASIEEQITRRTEARRLLATRRAGYAKAGVMMEGSPMEAQLDVASEMSEDIRRLTEQYGFAEQRAKSEAEIERYKASAARRAGRINIFTSVLGGGADIFTFKSQQKLLEMYG
jgi:predicted transcriptional regulator